MKVKYEVDLPMGNRIKTIKGEKEFKDGTRLETIKTNILVDYSMEYRAVRIDTISVTITEVIK